MKNGNFHIARACRLIASVSEIGFSHKDIQTEDVLLASGVSHLRAGSGSPVFSSARGLKIQADQGFCSKLLIIALRKLIGIMTGHLQFDPGKQKRWKGKKRRLRDIQAYPISLKLPL